MSGINEESRRVIELIDNDVVYESEKEVADKFSIFFSDIALTLNRNLPVSNADPCDTIDRNVHSFMLFPITHGECMRCIRSLKITKTNLNTMPVRVFKTISPYVLDPLVKIFNECFSRGVFPMILKRARITPIYKKGDRTSPTNYRPICSLPYLSKILEKILKNRMLKFFTKFSLFF